MKKYIITTVVFTACLALCATMWPQTGTVEETPVTIQATVVSAPAPTYETIVAETETTPPTEEEKVEIPQAEPIHEDTPELGPAIKEIYEISEAQPTAESEAKPVPVPEPTPAQAPPQAVTDSQPGDMVYVPGFGWLESQGPGEVIHDENMYENGNKIGVMG